MKTTTFPRAARLALSLFPALLIVVAGVVAAQDRDRPGRDRGDRADLGQRHAERLARALQLTDAQQEEWQRLQQEHRTAVRALMADMRNLTQRLDRAASVEDPDPATVGQLELDRRAIGEKMRDLRAHLDEAQFNLLDHDQKIRWEAVKENLRRGPRQRSDRGRGGPRRGGR